MEQARYWMWLRRKHSLSGDSWEEQAFAEDAAGPLGGCIWPPRSYSCSFCRREFRSAQALGGHMNVHRRDRARLKQSPSPHNEAVHHHHENHYNHISNPCTSLDVQYPSQICSRGYNPNPDSDPVVFASPSSPSRVSPPPTQEKRNKKTSIPLFSSPILEEDHKKSSMYARPSWPNLVSNRYFHISDLKKEEKNSKFLVPNSRAKEDYVTADLSVSLNLVVHRTHQTSCGVNEEAISCKRRRTDSTPLSSFLKSNSGGSHRLQSEKLELSSSSIEELDLELRLGDRPEVK